MKTARIIERSEVARDWHARGFSCGLWIDHAGRSLNGTPNETEELFMMLSGELELEIDGTRFQPDVGEEVVIPPQVEHTIRNIGGKTAKWLYGQKLRERVSFEIL